MWPFDRVYFVIAVFFALVLAASSPHAIGGSYPSVTHLSQAPQCSRLRAPIFAKHSSVGALRRTPALARSDVVMPASDRGRLYQRAKLAKRSREVSETLPNSCSPRAPEIYPPLPNPARPEMANKLLRPRFGQVWPSCGRMGPELATRHGRCQPKWANILPTSTSIGLCFPTLAERGQALTNARLMLAELWHRLLLVVDAGLFLVDFCETSSHNAQSGPELPALR